MTAFAVAVGIAIVALVLWDVAGTVLHPNAAGAALSGGQSRLVGHSTDGGPRERARWRPDVGPSLGLTATILVWIVGLAVGYALTCT
jgi:hypothetical protein